MNPTGDLTDGRVAIYIDFDNIVISHYNAVHGRNRFFTDKVRHHSPDWLATDADTRQKLAAATVDFSAILDYASSFGPAVIRRAYADWTVPVNATYRQQLIGRAVDLTQLFAVTVQLKNGADIRLAVDVMEDLFRLPDLTHVVIVAGDSDYIALAQKCSRLGRHVIGIGVDGARSSALAAACDEFVHYTDLPGITVADASPPAATGESVSSSDAPAPAPDKPVDLQARATDLLKRSARLLHSKSDSEWLFSAEVKSQMRRLDPSYNEKAIGYSSFSDFVRSRPKIVELKATTPTAPRLIRLLPSARK